MCTALVNILAVRLHRIAAKILRPCIALLGFGEAGGNAQVVSGKAGVQYLIERHTQHHRVFRAMDGAALVGDRVGDHP